MHHEIGSAYEHEHERIEIHHSSTSDQPVDLAPCEIDGRCFPNLVINKSFNFVHFGESYGVWKARQLKATG